MKMKNNAFVVADKADLMALRSCHDVMLVIRGGENVSMARK